MEVTDSTDYLIDRVSEYPWSEIHDTVQEEVVKNISQKKKCKKPKWLSQGALQIAEKRREDKAKIYSNSRPLSR